MVIKLGELSATAADTSKMVLDQLRTQLGRRSTDGSLQRPHPQVQDRDKLDRRLKSIAGRDIAAQCAEGRSLAGIPGTYPGTELGRRGSQQPHQLTEMATMQSMRDQPASELHRGLALVNFI
jgi:hypothetical protein